MAPVICQEPTQLEAIVIRMATLAPAPRRWMIIYARRCNTVKRRNVTLVLSSQKLPERGRSRITFCCCVLFSIRRDVQCNYFFTKSPSSSGTPDSVLARGSYTTCSQQESPQCTALPERGGSVIAGLFSYLFINCE